MPRRKKVVITAGDPAGCGPFIVAKAVYDFPSRNTDFFIVGDRCLFEEIKLFKQIKKQVTFIDANTTGIQSIEKGFPSKISGLASLRYLQIALDLMRRQNIQRLVTAPLSKEAVQKVQPRFSGHTEFLADYFKISTVVMMMVSKALRVVLLTRHIPLDSVSAHLKKNEIIKTLSLAYTFLKKQCGIHNPRLVVCSVNPHAGCSTFLGNEEKKILTALKTCKLPITGPYPADSLFIPRNLKKYDCIVCAYHDQALIPFKLLSFCDGVNVTVGLPIVRTSPAHGVAFDLMRRNLKPSASSMSAALELALRLRPV